MTLNDTGEMAEADETVDKPDLLAGAPDDVRDLTDRELQLYQTMLLRQLVAGVRSIGEMQQYVTNETNAAKASMARAAKSKGPMGMVARMMLGEGIGNG